MIGQNNFSDALDEQLLQTYERSLINFKKCISLPENILTIFIEIAMSFGLSISIGILHEGCTNRAEFITDSEKIPKISFLAKRILYVSMGKSGINLEDWSKYFGEAEVFWIRNNSSLLRLSSKFYLPRKFRLFNSDDTEWNYEKGHFPDLKGTNVTVGYFLVNALAFIVEDGHLDGFEVRLINATSKALNFTPVFIKLPEEEGWGTQLDNGTWVGGIKGALTDKRIDIGICAIYIMQSYLKYFDFSDEYTRMRFTLLVPKEQPQKKWRAIFQPFSLTVWLCLLLSYVVLTVAYRITDPGRISWTLSWSRVMGQLLATFALRIEHRTRTRLVVLSILLLGLLLATAYSSSIAARLTTPSYIKPYSTIRDLLKNNIPWGMVAVTKYQASVYIDPNNTIHKKHLERNYLEDITVEKVRNLIHEGRFTPTASRMGIGPYFESEIMLEKWENLELRYLNENFGTFSVALGLKKNFLITSYLNRCIRRLCFGGLVNKMIEDTSLLDGARPGMPPSISDLRPEPLTLAALKGVFYILIFGLILAILCFMREIYHNKQIFNSPKKIVACFAERPN